MIRCIDRQSSCHSRPRIAEGEPRRARLTSANDFFIQDFVYRQQLEFASFFTATALGVGIHANHSDHGHTVNCGRCLGWQFTQELTPPATLQSDRPVGPARWQITDSECDGGEHDKSDDEGNHIERSDSVKQAAQARLAAKTPIIRRQILRKTERGRPWNFELLLWVALMELSLTSNERRQFPGRTSVARS